MFEIKLSGLEQLEKEFDELQQAMACLDGTIAELSFNSDDPGSVEEAIRTMEAAVDARIARYRHNSVVSEIAEQFKATSKKKIMDMVASSQQ